MAIPVMSVIIVPLVLLGCAIMWLSPLLASGCFHIANGSLWLLWHYLSYLATVPWGHMILGKPSFAMMLVGTVGTLWCFAPKGMVGRYFSVILILPCFLAHPKLPTHGQVKVWVFDVGQGLSVFVQTRYHRLLYDVGPSRPGRFSAVRSVVLPNLYHLGCFHLNMLMISHGDNDHSGGTYDLLSVMPADLVSTSKPSKLRYIQTKLKKQLNLRIPFRRCRAGQHWSWDGVDFKVLSPFKKPKRILTFDVTNNAFGHCFLLIL